MNGIDRVEDNTFANNFERDAKKTLLTSTPRYVTIGAHYGCNARCVFCLGGDYPRFTLQVYRELFEQKMLPVLKNAEHIGFCGFGEILLMPGIEGFLDHINATLPDNTKVFTTNGIALTSPVCEKLTDGRYSVLISLHASRRELHEKITGTKTFDTVLQNIRNLARLKRSKQRPTHVNLIFLATTLNIDDLPDFVRLAKALEADRVTCNHLSIFEPEQFKLSCFFAQEKTNRAFDEAERVADQLGMDLGLPLRFGRHTKREGEIPCHDPWNFFYVETQGSVNPCCFSGDHIGYLNKSDFESIWNGPGYTRLREGLVTGNIHTWCRHCYRYDPNNINDIRSHITFRPETQQRLLQFLQEHQDEYPLRGFSLADTIGQEP